MPRHVFAGERGGCFLFLSRRTPNFEETGELEPWIPIPGLSDTLNTMMAEEWALLDALEQTAPGSEEHLSILDMLIANGRRIDQRPME